MTNWMTLMYQRTLVFQYRSAILILCVLCLQIMFFESVRLFLAGSLKKMHTTVNSLIV